MAMFGSSFPIDGAKERFAELHFRAACVRLELLARTLHAIEEGGGISKVPIALVSEAVTASADVTENLRWSYERLTETGHRLSGEPPQLGFPGERTVVDGQWDYPAARREEKPRKKPGDAGRS